MKTMFGQIVALIVLALVPALAALRWHPEFAAALAPDFSPANEVELRSVEKWTPPPLWVDARSTAAFARAHIPGALPLDEQKWDEQLPTLLQRWQPGMRIVVYCDGAKCDLAHHAARRLRQQVGLPEVYVLRGGWETWTKAHP
ncbi:MAG: hypothetical protein HZA31_10425 [Opitutae bacterium]|nr:hypothetical protein [Opitutae bacterium]